jgi:hypothetical protein
VKRLTWQYKWRQLEKELPTVRDYLGTGAYTYKDAYWDERDDVANVMRDTQRGAVVNVIVRLAV